MTDNIPKVPQGSLYAGSIFDYKYKDDLVAHYEAVARRAVSALEAFVTANDCGPATDWVKRMHECDRLARAALDEIKASGWEGK